VGFGLGWDTQIPRNSNPNKTQKSQTKLKNHRNFDPKVSKARKLFPKNFMRWDFLGFLGLLGFSGKISGYLAQVWEKF
jgi:hypothetical protein